jgi:hypothetical protein
MNENAGDRLTLYTSALTRAIEEGSASLRAMRDLAGIHGLTDGEVRAAHCIVAAAMLTHAAEAGDVSVEEAEHLSRAFALLRLAGWSPA